MMASDGGVVAKHLTMTQTMLFRHTLRCPFKAASLQLFTCDQRYHYQHLTPQSRSLA